MDQTEWSVSQSENDSFDSFGLVWFHTYPNVNKPENILINSSTNLLEPKLIKTSWAENTIHESVQSHFPVHRVGWRARGNVVKLQCDGCVPRDWRTAGREHTRVLLEHTRVELTSVFCVYVVIPSSVYLCFVHPTLCSVYALPPGGVSCSTVTAG